MATLEKIRKRSVLLLIVIAVALLAFIIGDALTNSRQIFGNGTTVAQVGSNKIDLMEYQRRVSEANEQLRNTPNAPDGQALQQMVLEQMVAEALLDEAVGKMGVRVGGDLLRIYMFNAQIPEVQLIMQQLNQAGVPVQTPEQAWNAIFNPQQYGKTAQDMESFRQAWIAAESSAKKGMARELYQGALAGAFQPNDIDRQMLAQDFNTQVKANYAFKPYGNLDAKQYPVSDQEKQAAYDELKHMYKVEAPTKSVAFIRVDVTPSQSDLNASKALAAKTRGELARGGQLGGQKPLELRLAVLNGLHGAFHEVQVLVEVQNGGIGHVVGGLLRDGPDRGPHNCEDEHDDQGQAREALPIPDGVLGRLHSGGAPFPFEICLLNSTSSEGKLQGENGIRQGENEARPQRDAHKKAPPAGEPEELCSVRTEEKGITCAWKSFPPRGF